MKVNRGYFFAAFLALLFLCAGIGGGYFWGYKNEQAVLNKKLSSIHPLRDNNSSYKFVDPLLAYIIPSNDQEVQMVSLGKKITDFINAGKNSNSLSDASVFFYDLNRGRWIGVNQNAQYNPASMLKVVIMVACLKESETNPGILNQYLTYSKIIDDAVNQNQFDALSELKIGNMYKVDDLINKMIVDSDNGAAYLLLSAIDQNYLDSIYNALNIENPTGKADFTISPRTYSLFLRILYSATYLNAADSEKALNILSEATFNDGLVAGLPKGVVVSHKFGEHVISQTAEQAQQVELHDCGIVYYPKNPYLLCVMTKGDNLDNLKSAIKNISSIVYKNYSGLK